MNQRQFPVIDLPATGANIARIRAQRGLSVKDLQIYFGFEEPQAIYKWQRGKCLPSVDHLYALAALLDVSMEEILVPMRGKMNITANEQQADACCSVFIIIAWGSRVVIEPVVQSLHLFAGCAIMSKKSDTGRIHLWQKAKIRS